MNIDDYQEYDDTVLDTRRLKREQPKRKFRHDIARARTTLADHDDRADTGFNPTFTGTVHERAWIQSSLAPFYEEELITDVLYAVKGGKEASVYCCQAHPASGLSLIAAKVYRPRMFRSLRNDALYKENRIMLDGSGKGIRDQRRQRAIHKKTDFGSELQMTSWITHEYQTMKLLYTAGVAIPRPLGMAENAILMEYLGDDRIAAPLLQRVSLASAEAQALFTLVLQHIALMLRHDRIHADLSAYNILYWQGAIKIIDFPQAIDPNYNPNAFVLLTRDIERVCQHFARFGVVSNPSDLSRDLWQRQYSNR